MSTTILYLFLIAIIAGLFLYWLFRVVHSTTYTTRLYGGQLGTQVDVVHHYLFRKVVTTYICIAPSRGLAQATWANLATGESVNFLTLGSKLNEVAQAAALLQALVAAQKEGLI